MDIKVCLQEERETTGRRRQKSSVHKWNWFQLILVQILMRRPSLWSPSTSKSKRTRNWSIAWSPCPSWGRPGRSTWRRRSWRGRSGWSCGTASSWAHEAGRSSPCCGCCPATTSRWLVYNHLKVQCHEIFCIRIFSSSPKPRKYLQDHFEFFRKFAEIFASQGGPPVSTTQVANLPPVMTPVANLTSVSTAPVANLPRVHLELNWEYFREFPNKFETALMRYSGAWGKLIHEKHEVENLVALSL